MSKKALMRVAVIAAAVLACGAIVAGCTSSSSSSSTPPSPSTVVKTTFDAMKAGDFETVQKNVNAEVDTSMLEGANAFSFGDTSVEITEDQMVVVDKITAKIKDFDYAVKGEKIDGNKATVEVEITTYDFGGMFMNVFNDYMSQALSYALTSADDPDLEEKMTTLAMSILDTRVGELTQKDQVNTATVNLVKTDKGTWLIDNVDEELTDALLGGLVSSLEGLMNSFDFDVDAA